MRRRQKSPQVTLARQNISLAGNAFCTPPPGADGKKALPGYCYYADLSLTIGQTFSDLLTQQNFNIAGGATVGWRIHHTDFVVALQTTVTSRTYTNFPGGRRDVQVGPVLKYTRGNFAFSLPVTYNQNFSSVAAAEWNGVVIQPTLTISFPVELSSS